MEESLLGQLKERRSIVDITYEILQDRIINGDLAVSGTINQVELAKDLNVSRTVIREALQRLAAKNLIKFELNHSAVMVNVSPEELHDIITIREKMETIAIRRAIPHITEETIRILERISQELASETDSGRWLKLDRTWHLTLYRASGNELLCEMINDTRINIQRFMRAGSYRRNEEVVQEHAKILEAVKSRDAELAEKHLQDHIKKTELALQTKLNKIKKP
jgi:DNA-binding GntR family transcriptional regulator